MKQFTTILAITLLSALSLSAANQAEIRERIAERVPQVRALWATKLVGEANNGYLKVLGNITSEQAKIIQEENADRKQLYIIVSQRHGDALEAIEKSNAPKIHAQVPAGTMIQTPGGQWIEKK